MNKTSILRSMWLATICLPLITGCRKEYGTSNAYYDRMKKLAEELKANPNNKAPLRKLEAYTIDPDYWNRCTAFGFLESLAIANVGGCQNELIPYIHKALKNDDLSIRREAASAIGDIGSPAVDETSPTLLDIISVGKEDDVTWFSTQAIGKLQNPQKAQEVLPVLFKAAATPPTPGTPDEAPQERYYALDSIEELAKKNALNVVPALQQLLNESKSPYKERIAKVVLELSQ